MFTFSAVLRQCWGTKDCDGESVEVRGDGVGMVPEKLVMVWMGTE